MIDRLIASVLAEMGACSAPETRPGVRQAGGVTHVDSKAQYWGGSRAKGSVAVMDVLSPAKGDAASVGYLDWEMRYLIDLEAAVRQWKAGGENP